MKFFKKFLKWVGIVTGGLAVTWIIIMLLWMRATDFWEHNKKQVYEQKIDHPELNTLAPEYTLFVDSGTPGNPNPTKLNSLKGKTILLFWYSPCSGASGMLDLIGKLSQEYPNELLVYVLRKKNDRILLENKDKYPQLNFCELQGRGEEVFVHTSAYHTVMIDKKGFIKAYAVNGFVELLANKLILEDGFTQTEEEISLHYSLSHKMELTVSAEDEFLYFEKSAQQTSRDQLADGSYYSISCRNVSGLQIYELITGVKREKFVFQNIDTAQLAMRYNFVYGINDEQYVMKKKPDITGLKNDFKKNAIARLDSLFDLQTMINISDNDSTLLFKPLILTED